MPPRLATALCATLVVHAGAGFAIWSSYRPVRPFVECVEPAGPGYLRAHFGYFHEGQENLEIPSGDRNLLVGARALPSPPTSFLPGRSESYPEAALTVHFEGEGVTWVVDGREATATRDSHRCPVDPREALAVPEFVIIKPPEPPPPEPPKPEPPPEPPPKPVEQPVEPADPTREPTRKPKAYHEQQGQPKPKPKLAKAQEDPPPLLLDMPHTVKLTSLNGGVNVQQWEDDHLGDPGVEANPQNTDPELVDNPKQVPVKVGEGGGGASGPRPPKIVEPKVRVRVPGAYPPGAPQLGRAVSVTLSLLIGADGKATEIRVVKGAGEPFDSEARRVGHQLVFSPGSQDGTPKSMWVRWTVVFQPE
jgi:protein TonB